MTQSVFVELLLLGLAWGVMNAGVMESDLTGSNEAHSRCVILMQSTDLLWNMTSNQQINHPQMVDILSSDLQSVSDN